MPELKLSKCPFFVMELKLSKCLFRTGAQTLNVQNLLRSSSSALIKLGQNHLIKKLVFGEDKCVKMHVGCKTMICPLNIIDTWGVESKTEAMNTILDLVDIETDPLIMEIEDN